MIDGVPLIVGRPPMEGGLFYLRCEQHLAAMARKLVAYCPVLHKDDDKDLAWKAKVQADCFVSCGWPIVGQYDLIHEWCDRGKPWVWDIDDDPTHVSPFNFAYRAYGLKEVKFAEPVNGRNYLWKDGEEGFCLDDNHRRQESFTKMIRDDVSAITTTTPYLAAKLLDLFDKPVYLRPNVLDFSDIWTRPKRQSKDGLVRIVYQGGSSHSMDLQEIIAALGQIVEDFPHVRLVFQGDTKSHAEKMIPADKIETFEWCGDYRMFAIRFAEIGADISIAPLSMDENHAEFNRCKSPLKWLDAAALAIPSVCTWDTPYQEVVNFGRVPDSQWNGLLAKTTEDWYASLAALIQSKEMREVVGNNAQREAYQHWSADDYAEEHLAQYMEILSNDGGNGNTQRVANEVGETSRA